MRRLGLAGSGIAALLIACSPTASNPSATPTNSPQFYTQNFTCNSLSDPAIPKEFRDLESRIIDDYQTFEGFTDEDYANRTESGNRMPAGNAYKDDKLDGDIFGLNMLIVHLPSGDAIGVKTYVGKISVLCKNPDGFPYVYLEEPDDTLTEAIANYSFKSNPDQGAFQLMLSKSNIRSIPEKEIPSEPIKVSDIIDSIRQIPDSEYSSRFNEVPSWDITLGGVAFRLESGLAYEGHPLLSHNGDTDATHYVVVSVPFSIDVTSDHNKPIFEKGIDSVVTSYQEGF